MQIPDNAPLAERFAAAAIAVRKLPNALTPDVQMKLYGLYKQGSEGDISGSRPASLDYVARAKHDAWAVFEGLDPESAQAQYIDMVQSLIDAA